MAVDSWEGDAHTGLYSDDIYNDLAKFQSAHFPMCSRLLRCRFDEAVEQFQDGSVDLLHLDGCHSYDAVRHDFETWRRKLSDRAVVLLHDTEIRSRGFGVWKLWQELSDQHPSFNFNHAAGLGVLAVGPYPPPRIAALCSQRSEEMRAIVCRCFMQASEFAQRNGVREINERRERILEAVAGGRRNLALDRSASQSSALEGSTPTPQGGVDGVKSGKFGFHTDFEPQPWWMVDLGEATTFDEVVIYNRLDAGCQQRARSLVVLISVDGENWTTIYTHSGTDFGGIDGFPLRVGCRASIARFIRIKLSDRQYLHLDEIEIYRDPDILSELVPTGWLSSISRAMGGTPGGDERWTDGAADGCL